jgi:hypothetical protein
MAPPNSQAAQSMPPQVKQTQQLYSPPPPPQQQQQQQVQVPPQQPQSNPLLIQQQMNQQQQVPGAQLSPINEYGMGGYEKYAFYNNGYHHDNAWDVPADNNMFVSQL